MKTLQFYLFAIIATFIINFGCTKDDPITSTTLEIRLIDESGNSVSGATVKLYKSLNDLQNKVNQLGTTQTSDSDGKVRFSNLDAITYYWFVEKGCLNNVNSILTTDALESGKTKVITSTLYETGTLELTNQSAAQYQVFVNGFLFLTADAGFVYTYEYVPAGSYSIRVLQVGGTDEKTYTGNINCSGTLSITFP